MKNLIKIIALVAITFSLTACKTTEKKENKSLTKFNKMIAKKNKTLSKSQKSRECSVTKQYHAKKTKIALKTLNKFYTTIRNHRYSKKSVQQNWTRYTLKNQPKAETRAYEKNRRAAVVNMHYAKGLGCAWATK